MRLAKYIVFCFLQNELYGKLLALVIAQITYLLFFSLTFCRVVWMFE